MYFSSDLKTWLRSWLDPQHNFIGVFDLLCQQKFSWNILFKCFIRSVSFCTAFGVFILFIEIL